MNLETDLGTVVNAEAAELFDKRVSKAEEDGAKNFISSRKKWCFVTPNSGR